MRLLDHLQRGLSMVTYIVDPTPSHAQMAKAEQDVCALARLAFC